MFRHQGTWTYPFRNPRLSCCKTNPVLLKQASDWIESRGCVCFRHYLSNSQDIEGYYFSQIRSFATNCLQNPNIYFISHKGLAPTEAFLRLCFPFTFSINSAKYANCSNREKNKFPKNHLSLQLKRPHTSPMLEIVKTKQNFSSISRPAKYKHSLHKGKNFKFLFFKPHQRWPKYLESVYPVSPKLSTECARISNKLTH